MDRLAHWFILILATTNGRQIGRRFFFGTVLGLAANVCIFRGASCRDLFLDRYFATIGLPLTLVSCGFETSRLRFPFRKLDDQRTIGAAIKIEE
jgi:hypothetical protein